MNSSRILDLNLNQSIIHFNKFDIFERYEHYLWSKLLRYSRRSARPVEEEERRAVAAEVLSVHLCPLLQRRLSEAGLEGAQAALPGDRSEAGRRCGWTERSVRLGS